MEFLRINIRRFFRFRNVLAVVSSSLNVLLFHSHARIPRSCHAATEKVQGRLNYEWDESQRVDGTDLCKSNIEIAKNTITCFILVLEIIIYRLLSIIIYRFLSIIKFMSLSASHTHGNS